MDSTNCTQKESTVDGLDTTLGNLNKKDERWSVDSILEPATAVMDIDSFILNCETHNA